MIVSDPPYWLILLVEIPTYVAYTYQSYAWIVANVVVYVFVMHFDYAIQVTDLSMKIFCIATCVILSSISMTLDYFVPYFNTVVYNLFGLRPDMDRYEMSKLHM